MDKDKPVGGYLDDLNRARGCVIGTLISLAMWAVIGFIIWLLM